ncbi:MAG: tetratricopeptide repeat protein [Deltaproteobacteria bacterium]|nr:tetratricopeptide repeat protein [Deltaproteobacteria bacterium]
MVRFLGSAILLICMILSGCASIKVASDYEQALRAFQKQLYADAETHLQSALRQKPRNERSLSLQGWVFFKMGMMEESEKVFKLAYQINPENISTVEGLAWIDYAKGQNQDAKNRFRKMIKYALAHFNNPYWADYPIADREYIQSVHSNANYGLGLIAKRMGQWDLARKYLEEAINRPSASIDLEEMRSLLVEILFELREFKQALTHYQILKSGRENSSFFLNRYAWCLYQTGNIEEAKPFFLKSRALIASEAERYRGTSTVQNVTGKLIAKRIAETYYGLALIYAKEKNMEEGRKELSFALSLSPFFHSPEEITKVFKPFPE